MAKFIKIIGSLLVVWGVFKSVLSFYLVTRGLSISNPPAMELCKTLGKFACLVVGICYIVFGIGIIVRRKWAVKSLIGFLVILRTIDLSKVFISPKESNSLYFFFSELKVFFNPILTMFYIAILIFVIYFFTRPEIKEQFK